MASMNQHDMEALLGEILAEGESYTCMLWSIFTANSRGRICLAQTSDLLHYGHINMMPLSNTYAYVGLTGAHLNLVVVNSFNPRQIIDRFSVPFSAITRVEVRNGLIMGKVLIVNAGDAKIQLEMSSFASGNRDEEQQAARSQLIKRLVELNRRR